MPLPFCLARHLTSCRARATAYASPQQCPAGFFICWYGVDMQPLMRGDRAYGSASLELSVNKLLPKKMRDGTRELTRLHTPEADRGKGLASMLMEKVCREADKYRMFLLLTAGEGLERFYRKYGFVVVQQHPITIMARAPFTHV